MTTMDRHRNRKSDERQQHEPKRLASKLTTDVDSLAPSQIRSEEFYSVGSSSVITVDEVLVPLRDEEEANSKVRKDSIYSWIACLAAFLDALCLMGFVNTYSLLLVQFQKDFGCSLSEGAWLGSTMMGLIRLCGPLASFLAMRRGSRRVMMCGCIICCSAFVASSFVQNYHLLFVTMAIPFGLGASMVSTPALVVPTEYFKKHKTLATGIVMSGSSMGTLIVSPILQNILETTGWRVALRYFAISYAILIIPNAMIKTTRKLDKDTRSQGLCEDLKLWKSTVFVIWVLTIAIGYMGYHVPLIFLASYAGFIGIPPTQAAYFLMAMGGATTFARLATGSLLKCDLLNKLHAKQVIFIVMGTSYLLLTHVTTPVGLGIFCVFRGLLDGAFVVMLPTVTASLVGARKAILGWGHLAGAISITYALGPVAAGALQEYYDSFTPAFVMAGLPLIVGGLLLFLLPWAQRSSRELRHVIEISKMDPVLKDNDLEEGMTAEVYPVYLEFDDRVESIQDFIAHRASVMVAKEQLEMRSRPSDLKSIKSFKSMTSKGTQRTQKKYARDLDWYSRKLGPGVVKQNQVSQSHSDTFVIALKSPKKPQMHDAQSDYGIQYNPRHQRRQSLSLHNVHTKSFEYN